MALKLSFEQQINISVTKDDLVYFTDTSPLGGYNTADLDDLVLIGPIISVKKRQGVQDIVKVLIPQTSTQVDFDLNFQDWVSSNNVPVDTDGFLVRINGLELDPVTGPNPFTLSSGIITFTNTFLPTDVIEVQLLYTISVDDSSFVPPPSPVLNSNSFIMFKKNEVINNSGLKGYYAEVNFKNNSIEKAELFAVSSEIVESSK
jgi:hypothetical protein